MAELRARPDVDGEASGGADATRTQVRGSSLLLFGRLLSMGINLATQVLIVRYLSKASYGAFAYALSFVTLGETVITLGLDRAVTRFVPIYDERRDYPKLLGTIVLVLGTMLGLGLVTVLLVIGLRGLIADHFVTDRNAVALLVILIFMAPIQALDGLSIGMFAVFARPRAIFVRRYVLAPGFRLLVVLLLVLTGSGVAFLAAGYVAAAGAGLALYGVILWRMIRARGLLSAANVRAIDMPFREVFAFTLPLLTSDLVYTVMNVSDAALLGYFRSTEDVAAFRAIQPTARLNQLVMSSFAFLFTPIAARLFAREDREGINQLYWQTAIWLAVLSFPVFALTFSLASPVTVMMFGDRYASSAVLLALLALGNYVQAASGFNGLTLKVFGKLRYVVVVNVVAAILNIVLNLLLIPRYGALGAALGTCSALLIHNLLKQTGLRLGTGINLLERDALKVYGVVIAAAALLWAVQAAFSPSLIVGVPLAAMASLWVLLASRPVLRAGEVFPELMRFRLFRLLIGRA